MRVQKEFLAEVTRIVSFKYCLRFGIGLAMIGLQDGAKGIIRLVLARKYKHPTTEVELS